MFVGTAQFGSSYGITNDSGPPDDCDVYELLELAWEHGVRGFDTAPAYGADKLLGNFFRTNGLQNQVEVLTKVPPLKASTNYKAVIRKTIVDSLEVISCSQIEVLFFHDPADSILFRQDPEYLSELRLEYPIKNYGISSYSPDDLEFSNPRNFSLSIQFPYNVLDRRFEAVPMQVGARYARSIFLQGLLVSDQELARPVPDHIKRFHRNYHDILRKKSIPALDYALACVNKSAIVDYLILGFVSAKQFKEILEFSEQFVFEEGVIDQLLGSINPAWLDPRTWT